MIGAIILLAIILAVVGLMCWQALEDYRDPYGYREIDRIAKKIQEKKRGR